MLSCCVAGFKVLFQHLSNPMNKANRNNRNNRNRNRTPSPYARRNSTDSFDRNTTYRPRFIRDSIYNSDQKQLARMVRITRDSINSSLAFDSDDRNDERDSSDSSDNEDNGENEVYLNKCDFCEHEATTKCQNCNEKICCLRCQSSKIISRSSYVYGRERLVEERITVCPNCAGGFSLWSCLFVLIFVIFSLLTQDKKK